MPYPDLPDTDRQPAPFAAPVSSPPPEMAPVTRVALHVYPEMMCCKPGRQMHGLTCAAGWMVGCMANHCARLPTLADRRAFAARVADIDCINQAGMQDAFRAEVLRLFTHKSSAKDES